MFYSFIVVIVLVFFKIFFRFKAFGKTNVPKEGPLIIASNHVSFFDPMAIAVGCPRKLNFMARESLFKNKFFAKLISSANAFPVNRERNDIKAFRIALDRLGEGKAVLVFPEGTRSHNGELQPPKYGIGFLAVRSKARIVPCYVKGTNEAWPKGAKFPRHKPISVSYGRVLEFGEELLKVEKNKKEKYAHIAAKVMQAIDELKRNAG